MARMKFAFDRVLFTHFAYLHLIDKSHDKVTKWQRIIKFYEMCCDTNCLPKFTEMTFVMALIMFKNN